MKNQANPAKSKTLTVELSAEWLEWIESCLAQIKKNAPYSDQTRAGLLRHCFKVGAREVAKALKVEVPKSQE